MTKWISAFLVFLAPTVAVAQTQPVQSGWHETFTRLVVPVSAESEWAVLKTDGGYVVQTDRAEFLDLTGSFELIPAQRISDLDVSQDGLEITVTCECYADAFLFRPNLLVVDIVEGDPPADSPFENAMSVPEPAPAVDLEFVATTPDNPNTLLEAISPLGQLRTNEVGRVNAFAESVAASLQLGIDQGLLRANPSRSSDEDRSTIEHGQADFVPNPDDNASAERALGLQATTSVDIGLELGSLTEGPASNVMCWPESYVSVVTWAPGKGFNEDLSLLRQKLFQDLEIPHPTAFRDLSRAYVYYSFGAEALKTVAASPAKTADLRAVQELANLIDDPNYVSDALQSQLACPGGVAVWALLSSDTANLAPDVDVDAIIADFRAFPDVLRAHLTPRMAERLTAVGELDAAKFLLEGRPNAPDLVGDLALVAAQIAEEEGNLSEAESVLEDAQAELAAPEPEVLARLIEMRIEQKSTIEAALVNDVEAALFANRGSPEAVGLFSALFKALIYNDEFERSFATLDRFSRSMPLDVVSDYENAVLNALVERGPEMMFLELAFADRAKDATPAVQNKFARRLTELGFPDRALETISGSAEGPVMASRRIIRAEAHLARGDPNSARQQIAGMDSAEALRILMRISEQEQVVEGPQSALEALQANRSDAEAPGAPLLDRAAALLSEEARLLPDTESPLRDSAALISQSEETRETVEALLNTFQLE